MSSHIHPSRASQISPPPPSKKRKRPSSPATEPSKPSKHNSLSARIRSVTRLLSHDETLPATVRAKKERELASLRVELTEQLDKRSRSEMIGKYHMVRFFERKKAERTLKRLRRELEGIDMGAGDERERVVELRKQTHVAEVDLNYCLYAPLREGYKGLFPGKGKGKGKQSNEKEALGEAKGLDIAEQDTIKRNKAVYASPHAPLQNSGSQASSATHERDDGATKAPRNNSEPPPENPSSTSTSARYSPTWYRIEAAMASGGTSALEEVREWIPPDWQAKFEGAQELSVRSKPGQKKKKKKNGPVRVEKRIPFERGEAKTKAVDVGKRREKAKKVDDRVPGETGANGNKGRGRGRGGGREDNMGVKNGDGDVGLGNDAGSEDLGDGGFFEKV